MILGILLERLHDSAGTYWPENEIAGLAALFRVPTVGLRRELAAAAAALPPHMAPSSQAHAVLILARALRRLLVDGQLPTENSGFPASTALPLPAENGFAHLDRVLTALETIAPIRARVAELHCYLGLSNPEIARLFAYAGNDVRRDWFAAREFLTAALQGGRES